MKRRDFIKAVLAGSTLLPHVGMASQVAVSPRILVLVELKGGNDGLNSVIPYRDPVYNEARPTIGIKTDRVIQLDDHRGLNPVFEPLVTCWNENEMAIVQGVGYEMPNRSHFRSADIWHSGSSSKDVLTEGWLSPYLDQLTINRTVAADAFILDARPFPCRGGSNRVVALGSPNKFVNRAKRIQPLDDNGKTGNDALNHILGVRDNIVSAAEIMSKDLRTQQNLRADFHCGKFGDQMTRASQLLLSGLQVPVIKVSQSGYDTHAGQYGPHQKLLTELAAGISDFRDRLIKAGKWDDVLIMTYSEFGRRVAENGSAGTDHGTASMQMLIGKSVKGGFYGEMPSLTDLDNGDLKYKVDYREVYATVLQEWFGLSSDKLPGGPYKGLGIIT